MTDIDLERLEKHHLELVRSWRNDPEVSKYMYTDVNVSYTEQLDWFYRVMNDPRYHYWMIKYGDKYLGVANLADIDLINSKCSWAFYLGDTSVRGQGIGSKVEYNVLQFVFDGLEMNKLNCEVFAFNTPVIQMHEKFGFRREAYYRDHIIKHGETYDVVGLSMLRRDWQKIQPFMKEKIYGH